MKTKRRVLGLLFLLISLGAGCKDQIVTSPPVPLFGDMQGGVQLYDTLFQEVLHNHAGVLVNLEGTDFSTITDSNGSWIIHNIPSGTYTIVYTKNNFALAKNLNHQFIGNGNDYLGIQNLYKLISIQVEIDSQFRILSNPVDHIGNFYGGESRKAIMLYSKTPFFSPIDPNSYLGLDVYKLELRDYIDTTGGFFISRYNLMPYTFKSGDTVYCRAYVGTYKCLDCSYSDLKTGKLIYTGFNNVSPLKRFIAQ